MLKSRILRILKWFFGIFAGLVMLITALLYIYRDDICGLIVDELNKHLKTEVQVSEVELSFWGSFPNLSVDFNHVFIKDSYPNATKFDTLLYSDRIRLKLNPLDIWREIYTVKSLEISPGVLKLKVNEEGINNFDILKERDEVEESEGFELKLEEVYFEGFRFSYINSATKQEYKTRLNTLALQGEFSASEFTVNAKSDLQIISARSGSIGLVNDKPANLQIGVHVNRDSNTVRIPRSTIYIANLPFDFQADILDSSFRIQLKGKNISIEDAANNLAMNEVGHVKKFKGTGKFLFDLKINGTNDPVQPVSAVCKFGVDKASLREPERGIQLSAIKLDGYYSNEGGPSKEQLRLSNVSFRSAAGPFKGNLAITQFARPIFKGAAEGTLDLSIVHALFHLPLIETLDGKVDVHADFKVQSITAPTGEMDYNIERCEGNVFMKGVNLSLINDKRLFRDMAGTVYLRNNDLGLENVKVLVGSSDFQLNGVFKNLVDFFKGRGNLLANVDIRSRQINLDEDLGTETREEKVLKNRSFILPDNIDGKLFLDVDRMIYDKHSFERLKGNITIEKRVLNFPKLTVQNGGTEAFGSLTIQEQSPEIFKITSNIASTNINFTRLFKEWDNFRQDVVKSNNIEGLAQANVEFEALFDVRSGVIPSSIVARIGIQIDNGRLKNVEAFQAIIASLKGSSATRLALKKEEIKILGDKLADLRFERMTNTLLIRDEMLVIPAMRIESSALNVDLAGKHSFDNKIDYKFGFYFRDLKLKKESEFGVEKDDGLGLNIYVRMYGDLNNPTIEWDKDARKENTKAYNQQEKENLKSILKSEFGLFKKDTTVRQFIKTKDVHESVEIDFDAKEELNPFVGDDKPKRDKKEDGLLNKWRQEAEKDKRKVIDIDGL